MEKLSLEKLKDFEIERDGMRTFEGGSSSTDECSSMTGLLMMDFQTDHYSDACGSWEFVGSTVCQQMIM